MSKKRTLNTADIWWLDVDWSNIGANVVSRPVEIEALNNINTQVKYINKLSNYDLSFTKEEIEIIKLDQYVNSSSLDYLKHKKQNLFKKDSVITKMSKLSGYSENYINRLLKSITRKIYLLEVLDINKINNNRYYVYNKKEYFKKKLSKYSRVI